MSDDNLKEWAQLPLRSREALLALLKATEAGEEVTRLHPSVKAALVRRGFARPRYWWLELTLLGWSVALALREAD